MPEYTYTDGEAKITVIHPFDWDGVIIAGSGVQMWRMPPQNVGINWNGLKPSDIEGQSPEIREHIKNADRLRDEYERNKDERVQSQQTD